MTEHNEETKISDNDSMIEEKVNGENRDGHRIDLIDKFSTSVIKIHTSIIFMIFALIFSHQQTSRNKDLKDDEINENDYYYGLLYLVTLIISFIRGVNSYFTLARDYEEIKEENIFKKNFMSSRE